MAREKDWRPGRGARSTTSRRAGVWRRALLREVAGLRTPRRLAAAVLLGVVGGVVLAALLSRGDASGADAQAYWAAGRLWLAGGDPYHPAGPFMPYVYSPWLLPAFTPWAMMPWDVAWFVWRGATVMALLWSVDWAYRRRPLATAVLLAALAAPMAINLDTGNVNLPLALALFGAQFAGPRLAGLVWALATTLKWAPAVLWPLLSRGARRWGAAWLGVAALLTLLTLPETIVQISVLVGFPRPPRIDYAVFAWAAVPWLYTHPEALRTASLTRLSAALRTAMARASARAERARQPSAVD